MDDKKLTKIAEDLMKVMKEFTDWRLRNEKLY